MDTVNETVVVPQTITEIVKGTTAEFAYYKEGNLYYTVQTDKYKYEFPIDTTNTEDIGESSFERTYKAITLMRYIRKAIANNTIRWGN
jgi:hypothetical protein